MKIGNNGADVSSDVCVKYILGVVGELNNSIIFLILSCVL